MITVLTADLGSGTSASSKGANLSDDVARIAESPVDDVARVAEGSVDDVVESGSNMSWYNADGSMNYPHNNGAVP